MHACFISYCHDDSTFTQRFISELKEALKNGLGQLMDETVFLDEDRLKPGYIFDETLAHAICHSLCMIVVYTPKYERHAYCKRELEAMRRIEQVRRNVLGEERLHGKGLIIPIVLRGKVPPEISERYHYCDFRKFTTATPDITLNETYVKEIEAIAAAIHEHYQIVEQGDRDKVFDCATFCLPDAGEACGFVDAAAQPQPRFPGR